MRRLGVSDTAGEVRRKGDSSPPGREANDWSCSDERALLLGGRSGAVGPAFVPFLQGDDGTLRGLVVVALKLGRHNLVPDVQAYGIELILLQLQRAEALVEVATQMQAFEGALGHGNTLVGEAD